MADEKAMKAFEEAYLSGSRNPELLKQVILFRKNRGKDIGPVLDDYTRSVPDDSLKSISNIQYIAGNAPVLKSYSDSVIRSDMDRFSEAWYRMDLHTRVSINNMVIDKSINIAIAEKDQQKAISVASFAARVNSNNPDRIKAFNQLMMKYHRSTKDTANYFRYATMLYDQYYLKISVDSLKIKDSLTRLQMIANTAPHDLLPNESSQQVKRTIAYTPTTQFFAADLNNGAFSFYTMGADAALTKKALYWSSRSLEFYETPANLDTYARLLYKTGKRDSAVYYQKKAVQLQAKSKFPNSEIENVLKKMLKGEAKIDEYCCELEGSMLPGIK